LNKTLSAIAKSIDFPASCASAEPTFDLEGNRELKIFSCTSIDSFTAELIKVRCPYYFVCISGEQLSISDFIAGSVTVNGVIRELSFKEV
jgi:sporulation protein YqfC